MAAESPRPSVAVHSPSSSRSSLSLEPSDTRTQRRNRTALREFYGLKHAAPANALANVKYDESKPKSVLDEQGFDADSYVAGILSDESLEGILKVETGLVSDIRGFDGERKALVYDNYSKLIDATHTIKKMRENMDPMIPMTSGLAPALAHIAEESRTLAQQIKKRSGADQSLQKEDSKDVSDNASKRATLRWVLNTPSRLELLVQQNKREEAEADLVEIETILDSWKDVKGVEELRERARASLPED